MFSSGHCRGHRTQEWVFAEVTTDRKATKGRCSVRSTSRRFHYVNVQIWRGKCKTRKEMEKDASEPVSGCRRSNESYPVCSKRRQPCLGGRDKRDKSRSLTLIRSFSSQLLHTTPPSQLPSCKRQAIKLQSTFTPPKHTHYPRATYYEERIFPENYDYGVAAKERLSNIAKHWHRLGGSLPWLFAIRTTCTLHPHPLQHTGSLVRGWALVGAGGARKGWDIRTMVRTAISHVWSLWFVSVLV